MKKSIKNILWTIFWTLILSQLLTAIAGWTIVDPILNLIMPAKIDIEPLNFPQSHDGKLWIRVNLLNNGLSDVDSINVDYKLCSDDEYKRGILHLSTLKRDEKDYFEVGYDLNTNCSIKTEPAIIKVYKNTENKRYYAKFLESVSNVCMYCFMDIRVYERNKEITNLSYAFPFSEGNLTISNTGTSGFLDYEQFENKSQLVYQKDMDIKLYILDPSTACIRGDFERNWCEENNYSVS